MATDSSEPKQGSPSFFKVVRSPSAPNLSLPVAFVKRYFDKIPKNPTLRTATGEHSWRLKIKKIGEDYCFADGWEKLAQDAQLGIRDILVFWLIDSYTFQVSFFDEHGCDKDLPLNKTNDEDEDEDDDDDDDDDGDGVHDDGDTPDEDLYFQKVICMKTHKLYMLLPKKFVDAAGLINKSSIKLKDNEGKEWKIGLRVESYRSTKLFLSSGWPFFRQYHDLCDGDMCLFKYIKKEGVLFLAEMIKSKRPTQLHAPDVEMFKRKKRSPPVEQLNGGGGGGGVKIKVENEWGPEVEVLKRKTGRFPVEKECGGGVEVKIEDEFWPEVEAVKVNRGGPPVVKAGGGGGGGGEVKSKPETERVIRHKQVIYF